MTQLCPGRSQFPITKRIDGAVVSAEAGLIMNCTVTFKTKATHQHFVIRFEELRLGCDDHLKLFDGDLDYGQASIKDFSCRNSLASTPVIKTTGTYLTLHYTSSDSSKSRHADGFKIILTSVSEASRWECPHDYGVCRNNLCISRSLYCDEINHCLDNSDEFNCSKTSSFADDLSLSSAVIIIMIIALIVFAIIVIVLIVLYCRRDKDYYSQYQHQLQRIGMPLHPSTSVMFANQYQYMPAASNLSPYISINQPQTTRMTHGYSTLPINLARQVAMDKQNSGNFMHPPQPGLNGPMVMMTPAISTQRLQGPLNLVQINSPFPQSPRYQLKQPPQQAYTLARHHHQPR